MAVDSQPSTEKNVTNEPENKNVNADVVLEISESAKSDSPMDTDIEIVEEKSQNKQHQVSQQATLAEPMEIDSSPGNDDDVIEIHETPAAAVVPESAPKSSESESTTTALNNVEKVQEVSIENSLDSPAAVDIIANNSTEQPAAAAVADIAGNASESISEETAANNVTNKTENDLCKFTGFSLL